MKNPFGILGVDENVTQNELYEAYRAKRTEYADKRFAQGEEGTRACEMLDLIEEAYREADSILKSRITITSYESEFSGIESAIKAGKYEEAQRLLDTLSTRTAEWHYLQSVIFYKKMWYNECRSQLKTAIEKDPYNPKYKDAAMRLEKQLYQNAQQSQANKGFYDAQNDGRSYRHTSDTQTNNNDCGCTACDCCTAMICMDCLCNGSGC